MKNLLKFKPITLSEMNAVSLMKRVDTKFLATASQLPLIFSEIYKDYRILEISEQRRMRYATLYYDTLDKQFFKDHHNGKANRKKIRMRKYLDSDLCFLEIKEKNNAGVTNKVRCTVGDFEKALSVESMAFINTTTQKEWELAPVMYNLFRRITLVNNNMTERVTIDTDLRYKTESQEIKLPNLAIIEVKQERSRLKSPICKILKDLKISKVSFSKYCIGATRIFDDLKYNRFKEINLKINKLSN